MIVNFEEHEFENPEFFRMLGEKGILGEEEARNLIRKFSRNALSILIYLVQRGDLGKDELCRIWGDSIDFAYVNIEKTLFQANVAEMIPEKFARRHKVIPIYKFGPAVTVAAADPANRIIMERVEDMVRSPVSPVFSFPHDIEDAIDIQYKTQNTLNDFSRQISAELLLAKETGQTAQEGSPKLAGNEAVAEFTRSLLLLGVKEGAAAIHIEPGKDLVRVRFRVDGLLCEKMRLERPLLPGLISRLKVLAGADTGETRKPQKGRIYLSLLNKVIEFKFSIAPTIYGEKAVARIIGGGQIKDVPDLSELYLSKHVYDNLTRTIRHPGGIFLITGPAQSGKSTTLYSAISHINEPEKNIVAIEDVVEYRLDRITQVQLNPGADFGFSSAICSALDQDPDVILVGEVRDEGTVKRVIRAAMTGCLVLTATHASTALGGIIRLIELGADPFLLAPSLVGVMGQRLVRKLCYQCKEKYPLSPEEIKENFVWDGKTKVSFWQGKGCDQCGHTGFHGRLAIHEVFVVNHDVRSLVSANAPFSEICKSAYKSGFQGMRYDGMKKVIRGLTTIEEINRVAAPEEKM